MRRKFTDFSWLFLHFHAQIGGFCEYDILENTKPQVFTRLHTPAAKHRRFFYGLLQSKQYHPLDSYRIARSWLEGRLLLLQRLQRLRITYHSRAFVLPLQKRHTRFHFDAFVRLWLQLRLLIFLLFLLHERRAELHAPPFSFFADYFLDKKYACKAIIVLPSFISPFLSISHTLSSEINSASKNSSSSKCACTFSPECAR